MPLPPHKPCPPHDKGGPEQSSRGLGAMEEAEPEPKASGGREGCAAAAVNTLQPALSPAVHRWKHQGKCPMAVSDLSAALGLRLTS